MIFHIKRFERRTKIDSWLSFPFVLDLSPLVQHADDASPSSVYDLVSVVAHRGTMTSGHYTCFIYHRTAWYKCDDAWISPAQKAEVAAAQAYILFYVRRGLEYSEEV
jgi:ubiquitin carboxyl-terminal hydrolase 22/27/51